jgi:hypothetical protein
VSEEIIFAGRLVCGMSVAYTATPMRPLECTASFAHTSSHMARKRRLGVRRCLNTSFIPSSVLVMAAALASGMMLS